MAAIPRDAMAAEAEVIGELCLRHDQSISMKPPAPYLTGKTISGNLASKEPVTSVEFCWKMKMLLAVTPRSFFHWISTD